MLRYLVLAFLLGFGSSVAQEGPAAREPRQTCAKCPVRVSLIQLIANPEKYQGKFVQVFGYVSFVFEGSAVYLTRDDYDTGNPNNALWISVRKDLLTAEDLKRLEGKFVLLEGVFDGKSFGHMGLFSGTLRDVNRIQPLLTRGEYKRAIEAEAGQNK